MNEVTKKRGSIFYYEDYLPHDNSTHKHKCRVLFVGSNAIFYDAWWEGISKWTFIPVRKNCIFYRFPMVAIDRLNFEGFEFIDDISVQKLYLDLPQILVSLNKSDLDIKANQKTLLNINSPQIALYAKGKKGGHWSEALHVSTDSLTLDNLVKQITSIQNLEYIPGDKIILERAGLSKGYPSYFINCP